MRNDSRILLSWTVVLAPRMPLSQAAAAALGPSTRQAHLEEARLMFYLQAVLTMLAMLLSWFQRQMQVSCPRKATRVACVQQPGGPVSMLLQP